MRRKGRKLSPLYKATLAWRRWIRTQYEEGGPYYKPKKNKHPL